MPADPLFVTTVEELTRLSGHSYRTVRGRLEAAGVEPCAVEGRRTLYPAGRAIRALFEGDSVHGAAQARFYRDAEELLLRRLPRDLFAVGGFLHCLLADCAESLGLRDDEQVIRAVGICAMAYTSHAAFAAGVDDRDRDDGRPLAELPVWDAIVEAGGTAALAERLRAENAPATRARVAPLAEAEGMVAQFARRHVTPDVTLPAPEKA